MFRRLRDITDRALAGVWLASFTVLGRLRRRAALLNPGSEGRVMVIAPHPDDEVLGCGGTILRHLDNGTSVTVLYVSDGRLSRSRARSPDEMSAIRFREAAAVADMIGLRDIRWLGLPEGAWQEEQLTAYLETSIREIAPSTIYAPSGLDYHPEHRKVAACLAMTVPDATCVRIYTVHVPLGRLVNLRIDVTREFGQIEAMMRSYESQLNSLLRGLRLRRYAAAAWPAASAAEEFCAVSGAAYRHAHQTCIAMDRVRGIRNRSYTDPLCYLTGRRARSEFAYQLRIARAKATTNVLADMSCSGGQAE